VKRVWNRQPLMCARASVLWTLGAASHGVQHHNNMAQGVSSQVKEAGALTSSRDIRSSGLSSTQKTVGPIMITEGG
jgi:hypothetical protein